MLGIMLDQLVGRFKELVVRYSFYAFNGIVGGIFMNDIIRIIFGDFELKYPYQYMLAGIVGSSGYVLPEVAFFGDKNNNMFLGMGLALGQYWSNLSQKGEKIEVV